MVHPARVESWTYNHTPRQIWSGLQQKTTRKSNVSTSGEKETRHPACQSGILLGPAPDFETPIIPCRRSKFNERIPNLPKTKTCYGFWSSTLSMLIQNENWLDVSQHPQQLDWVQASSPMMLRALCPQCGRPNTLLGPSGASWRSPRPRFCPSSAGHGADPCPVRMGFEMEDPGNWIDHCTSKIVRACVFLLKGLFSCWVWTLNRRCSQWMLLKVWHFLDKG